ncbi:hypothetical protein F6455_05235 [Proteobacteria bacterium 005FR1]|nr:hypothetical protein [Proteobacteria bacterium 005FR1]
MINRERLRLLFCVLTLAGYSGAALGQNLNLAPDCSQARISPDTLWPPNARLTMVAIEGLSDPDGDAITLEAQCVLQDEPLEIWRRFFGREDAAGLGTAAPSVRAHRRPAFFTWDDWDWVKSDGRQYQIIFKATDSRGAMCSGSATVGVPLAPRRAVVDNGYRFESAAGGKNCGALPINNPPIIYSQPVTNSQVHAPYEYQVTGHDPDQDQLQYGLENAPEGMTIDVGQGLIQWAPSPAQAGPHTFSVTATDPGGLQARQQVALDVKPAVDELTLSIIANPTSGTSPLTVRFSPNIRNNNIVVTNYQWDFEGDGTIDRSDNFGAPQVRTYAGVPGDTFEASLTITTSGGERVTATKAIAIENQSPSVQVTSSATNGHAPLLVTFAVAADDLQGIQEVSIDYDGDGIYDDSVNPASTSGNWTFQTEYSQEGRYVATVRVVDTLGSETLVSNSAITVDINNPLDPVATLVASATTGSPTLAVNFTATAELFDGSDVVSWEWDLNGDGDFETAGGSGLSDSASFAYEGVDNYYPSARITTTTGLSTQASLAIRTESSAKPTLSISNSSDTINSDAGGIATMSLSLPWRTDLSLWIENAEGGHVKLLQAAEDHGPGSYSLQWDATDDNGAVVPEGDYYAVLGYTTYGQQREVDLRTSTGGALSYYRRTTSNPRSFDRLHQPLRIDYAVDDPAQVTFFWQVSFGARLMTLMEHERMGRGQYSLYWNAEYPSGKKIPNNLDRLMPGIVRYSLPSNVIFVKENPRIKNFTLDSTWVADPRREPVTINLELSKAGTAELVVADMEKGVDVANRVYQNLPAGAQKVTWDGKNNQGQFLAPGDYRIGIRSVDEHGKRSLYWFRSQRIQY